MRNNENGGHTPGTGAEITEGNTGHEPLCGHPEAEAQTASIEAGSLFTLRLKTKPALDVYRNFGGRYKWHDVPDNESIGSDLKLGYDRFAEFMGIEKEDVDVSSGFAGVVMANHIMQVVGSEHGLSVFKDHNPDVYRFALLTYVEYKGHYCSFSYLGMVSQLKGDANRKYLKLLHKCLKTLRNKLGVSMWQDVYEHHYQEEEPDESWYDWDEFLARHKEWRDTQLSYESGKAFRAFDKIMKAGFLTDGDLKRFEGDTHPVVVFAGELLELAKKGRRIEEFSYEPDDEQHGCQLLFEDQFLIYFKDDGVYRYQCEYVDSLANEGTQEPRFATFLDEMKELPDPKDDFIISIEQFFYKWEDLASQISRYHGGHLLVNILGGGDIDIENEVLIRI